MSLSRRRFFGLGAAAAASAAIAHTLEVSAATDPQPAADNSRLVLTNLRGDTVQDLPVRSIAHWVPVSIEVMETTCPCSDCSTSSQALWMFSGERAT